MNEPQHGRLIEFLREKAGGSLRGVLTYDESGWNVLYVREDLATDDLKDALAGLHERFLERTALVEEEEYPPLGSVYASVELHEGGVIFHFYESTAEGVVVTLEPEAGRQLLEFVSQCTDTLETPSNDE